MKKSRLRLPIAKRAKAAPKKEITKVNFYIKNVTDLLTQLYSPQDAKTALEASLGNGQKLFSEQNVDLNYQLLSMAKANPKTTFELITKSKQYKDEDTMYFDLNSFKSARINTIERENRYFYVAEFIESGIQCENPKCRSYNVRIFDRGPTSGDEAGRSIYKCNNCTWLKRV